MFSDIALIDADSIYFRMACVVSSDDKLHRNWKKAMRQGINHTINEIKKNTMTDHQLIAVKGKGNFRNEIYPKYKANRPALSEPRKEALAYGHQYMVDYHGAIMADGMEADDLVSIWSAEQRDYDQDPIVVGIDKDLLQIPGWHYNFVKKESQYIDVDKADHCLMLQCLTGDSTDNIPGIKGIGPKRAEKLLHGVSLGRRWGRVRAAWRANKAGDPTTSRRLLEMLTSWEELDDIRNKLESKTAQRKQDVLAGKESEDDRVSELPE